MVKKTNEHAQRVFEEVPPEEKVLYGLQRRREVEIEGQVVDEANQTRPGAALQDVRLRSDRQVGKSDGDLQASEEHHGHRVHYGLPHLEPLLPRGPLRFGRVLSFAGKLQRSQSST